MPCESAFGPNSSSNSAVELREYIVRDGSDGGPEIVSDVA